MNRVPSSVVLPKTTTAAPQPGFLRFVGKSECGGGGRGKPLSVSQRHGRPHSILRVVAIVPGASGSQDFSRWPEGREDKLSQGAPNCAFGSKLPAASYLSYTKNRTQTGLNHEGKVLAHVTEKSEWGADLQEIGLYFILGLIVDTCMLGYFTTSDNKFRCWLKEGAARCLHCGVILSPINQQVICGVSTRHQHFSNPHRSFIEGFANFILTCPILSIRKDPWFFTELT